MRSPLTRISVILLSGILSLVALELASCWWLRTHADRVQQALWVLRSDSALGWRLKAGLKTEFLGRGLVTDQDGFRADLMDGQKGGKTGSDSAVLGPSSAFGWGVEAQETWASLIGARNLSQIGYSIIQGRKLYESLPDRARIRNVFLAYGVNDVDRFRFDGDPVPDVEYFSKQVEPSSVFEARLSGIGLVALFGDAWQQASFDLGCGLRASPTLRVGVDGFKAALVSWVRALKADSKKVILVNTAFQMPFTDDDTRARRADELFEQSFQASKQGQCGLARRLFSDAREQEPWRVLRDVRRINLVIAEVGRLENVPVADIAAELERDPSGKLFVDPIHPSARGHAREAALIAAIDAYR